MDDRPLPWLPTIVFGSALIALILDAGGGPGWGAASSHAVVAARLDQLGTSPLYHLVAGVAALVPAGELGFRLSLLGALLGALTLLGVIAAARALLPRDPSAALIAVLLLLIAPPFRDAAAFASPSILAACGTAWSIACAARSARPEMERASEPLGERRMRVSPTGLEVPLREAEASPQATADRRSAAPQERWRVGTERDARDAACALGGCLLVIGSAPWLGAALSIAITLWLARSGASRKLLAICVGVIGVTVALWWLFAIGGLPATHGSLAAIAASGRGAAAIIIGAGLIGAGFGALTNLPKARWLAGLIAIVAVHEAIVGGAAPALLVALAVGAAIVPSGIIRAAAPKLAGGSRHAITLAAGVPLLAAAAAIGSTISVDDPGATPTELANDLVAGLPSGPGVFVATRPISLSALTYEAVVAGARPDLSLVPPLPGRQADAIVANALRADRIVGADASSFGRLDVRRAIPSGRGFQLIGDIPIRSSPPDSPARYATQIGAEEAIVLAVERARHEAASSRLDAAARAAGLEQRFGAGDLAVLGATLPTRDRPAMFGFLPLDAIPLGPWLVDVFGDDLAWVAGIEQPALDAHAPMPRRLHALWREHKTNPEDPAIVALGPRAVAATRELATTLGR